MDPITTLSGLVDAAAFVEGSSTASATKVTAELAQLLSKTNELVVGATSLAADLETEISDRASGDTAISNIVGTARAVTHSAELATHDSRIFSLESSYGYSVKYHDLPYNQTSLTLDIEDLVQYRLIFINRNSSGIALTVNLPYFTVDSWLAYSPNQERGIAPFSIVIGSTNDLVSIRPINSGAAYPWWGDGVQATGAETKIPVEAGGFITLSGIATASYFQWYLLGGKTYADRTA